MKLDRFPVRFCLYVHQRSRLPICQIDKDDVCISFWALKGHLTSHCRLYTGLYYIQTASYTIWIISIACSLPPLHKCCPSPHMTRWALASSTPFCRAHVMLITASSLRRTLELGHCVCTEEKTHKTGLFVLLQHWMKPEYWKRNSCSHFHTDCVWFYQQKRKKTKPTIYMYATTYIFTLLFLFFN